MWGLRRTTARAAAGLAVLATAFPAAAGATHLQPSATATLADEGAKGATRTVRVDVTGSCGPQAEPATQMSLSVAMHGRYAHDEHQPYLLESAVPLSPSDADATLPGPSASFRYRIEEGVLATARATVECTAPVPADAAEPETRSARSPFSNAVRAPWALDWSKQGEAFGGPPARCTPPRRRLQVGAGTDLRWDLSGLDMRGALGRPRVALASLRRIDLHISGGGRRADTFHPSRNGYKLYGGALLNGFYFIPRTTQSVKLWAQVGDARSNVVTIRVRRRPRGCSNAF